MDDHLSVFLLKLELAEDVISSWANVQALTQEEK